MQVYRVIWRKTRKYLTKSYNQYESSPVVVIYNIINIWYYIIIDDYPIILWSRFVGTHCTVKGFPIWTPITTAFCRAKVEHRGLRILHIIYRNYYWWLLSELWLPILTRPRSIIIYIALIGQILSAVAFGIRPAAGDTTRLISFFPVI